MSDTLIAIIIGIVEGLTEFIPVSSTGHMILVGNLIGYNDEAASVFEVFIQLGAILAVIFFYKDKFQRFFTAEAWDKNNSLSVWHVAAGIVPVMGIGYLLHKPIKMYLFSPYTVIIGLIAGGVMMLLAERFGGRKHTEDVMQITLKQAFFVGLFQIFALWPGFSRSGSTISGALFLGISRKAAADYSFIIAVPLMFVACIYDLLKSMHALSGNDLYMISVGFVVAFLVSYVAIVWFLRFLNKSSLAAFAYYRFALAALSYWYFTCKLIK